MSELDYCSVMQKRIEYFAKKYDPYNRFSVKEEILPKKIRKKEPKKIAQKISAGYCYIVSVLF